MAKSYARKKKDKDNLIASLKDQIQKNKDTYELNNELMKRRDELLKANIEDYEMSKEKLDIERALLEIELKNIDVVNPINKFHTMKEWAELFKKSKEHDLKETEKMMQTMKLNFDNNVERIESFRFSGINRKFTLADLQEQQRRIEELNPQLEEQLRKLGENIPKAPSEKQDYIG